MRVDPDGGATFVAEGRRPQPVSRGGGWVGAGCEHASPLRGALRRAVKNPILDGGTPRPARRKAQLDPRAQSANICIEICASARVTQRAPGRALASGKFALDEKNVVLSPPEASTP